MSKPRITVRFLRWALWVLSLFSSFALANSGISYHGRILRPDGTAVDSLTTQFRIQIRTPGTENCLLWEEYQTKDLSNTKGTFSVTIADSAEPSLIANTLPFTLERVFSNRSTFTGLSSCSAGSSYAPSSSFDGRSLQVYFRESTSDPWEQMPATKINFVPFALNSVQLEGFGSNEFLKIDPASSYTTLTATQVNTLMDIIAGTNTQYLRPTSSFNGDVTGTAGATVVEKIRGTNVVATAPTSGQVLKFDGTNWVPSADATGGAPSDSSYTVKGVVQVDTDLATSGLNIASGVLSLPNVVTAGTIGSATEIPVITYDAKGRITSTTFAAPNDASKLPLAGGSMTGSINMGTQNITNATSIAATNISTRNVILNDNDTNTATLRAPTDITPTSYTLTLPATDGNSGEVLSTDGSGNLSWVAPSSGSLTNVTSANSYVTINTPSAGVREVQANVGTAANTLAAGDDARITGALQSSAYATDLEDVDTCTSSQTTYWNTVSDKWACQNITGFVTTSTGFVQNGNSFGVPAVLGTNEAQPLHFETDSTTKMTILTDGNVGIGTTAPSTLLTTSANNSNLYSAGTTRAPSGTQIRAVNTNATTGTATALDLAVTGAAATEQHAHVAAVSTASGYAPNLVFGAANSSTTYAEWMRLDSSGNLGIGTTSPGAKLHVAGQIKITGGNPGAGKVLSTVDGTGLAEWVTLGGSESTSVLNVGAAGISPYKQMNGSAIELRSINAASSAVSVALDAANNEVDIGVNAELDGLAGISSNGFVKRTAAGSYTGVSAIDLTADITGILPLANGGTGSSTAAGARTNLGLGDSATKNVGTAAGTVAAGDDSRITGALQPTTGFMQNGNSFGAPAVLGTNEAQPLHFETDSSTRMTILSDGKVGIGTTSPTAKLMLNSTGSGFTDMVIKSAGPSGYRAGLFVQNFSDNTVAAGSNNIPVVNLEGYRGDGASTYTPMLANDTLGTINWRGSNTISTGLSNVAFIKVITPDGTNSRMDFGAKQLTNGGTPTTHMSITNTGDVGIGTTGPGAKLDVNGKATIGSRATYVNILSTIPNASVSILNADNNGGTPNIPVDLTLLQAHNTAGLAPTINLVKTRGDGYANLANGEELGKISFKGADGTQYVEGARVVASRDTTTNFANLQLHTHDGTSLTERVRITGAGNVGIGTTTPGAKLEVAGQIKIIGGNPGAGKVLSTVDGTGLAEWVTMGGSESTSVLNVGAGGVSPYKQMNGSAIELRSINAASSAVSVALDAANNEVDIGVNAELAGLSGLSSNGFVKRTAAGTYSSVSSLDLTTDVTGALPIANGGTGATTAANARTNLGLGGAATLNVGTTAGTVAAGDDSRITGALQSSAYTTDVTDAASCLTNEKPYWSTISDKWMCTAITGFLSSTNALSMNSVRVATTADITLSGTQTIDGVAVVVGDRVLVKNQSAKSQNGVYTVAAGAWTRSTDLDSWSETAGYRVIPTAGTRAGMEYRAVAATSGTIGTTSLEFRGNGGYGTDSTGGVALGINSGGGGQNTAIGDISQGYTTTGIANTSVGTYSLASNSTGSANVAIGHQAMTSNISGSRNVAIGQDALSSHDTDPENVAIGYEASVYQVSGSGNVSLGAYALNFNSASSENTAIGHKAMELFDGTATPTSKNTAVGAFALQGALSWLGDMNTAVGHSALVAIDGGSNNIALGYNAGSAITTGSNNVVIGSNTGSTIATTSGNILISDGAGNIRLQADNTGLVTIPGTIKIAGGSPALGRVLTSNASGVASWQDLPASAGGDVTGASNIGTAGVGVFKQETTGNLEFKKINAATSAITVTDDTAANELDIGVNAELAGLSGLSSNGFVKRTGAGTYSSGTIASSDLPVGLANGNILQNTQGSSLSTNNLLVTNATGIQQVTTPASGVMTASGTYPTWASSLSAPLGGTGQTSYAIGDLLYASSTSALSKLAAGTSGYVLKSNGPGTAPSWQAEAAGGANPAGSATEIQFRSNATTFGANSNFVWDNTNSRLGIGTNAPENRLHLYHPRTDTAVGYSSSAYLNTELNATANSSTSFRVQTNDIDSSGSFNYNQIIAGNNEAWHNGDGTVDSHIGLVGLSYNNSVSTGVITNSIGVHAITDVIQGGTTSNASAVVAQANLSGTGSINSAVGVMPSVYAGGGSINNANGIYTYVDEDGGTIANAIGVAIGTIEGTNKWSLFAGDPAAPSYFAGNVGIGETNPTEALTVVRPSGGNMIYQRADDGYSAILQDSIGGYSSLSAQTARTGWTILQDGDFIYEIGASGFDGNSFESGASISMQVTGAPADESMPTSLIFNTRAPAAANPSESMRISPNGYVGIGATSPRAALDVSKGAIVGRASLLNSTATVDFAGGNIQHTNSDCGSFSFHNLKDGGTYMFIVKGTTVATCSFTAYSDAGSTALTVHMPPNHAATTSGKHTIYNFAVSGGDVYLAWTPGY